MSAPTKRSGWQGTTISIPQHGSPTTTHTMLLDLSTIRAERLTESANTRYADALASWEEVKPLLPDKVRHMAGDFVKLCQQTHAFHSNLECNIDLVDEDSVMFDWNDGTLPMFTALITPNPMIFFVGRFKDGTVKGENSTLDLAEKNLRYFVNRLGNEIEIWKISVLQDLWSRRERVSLAAELVFTLHRGMENSPSSLPIMATTEISQGPEYMLRRA